ncbi:MAG TPA: LssY C-terminal domain-containing protein [Candidatus Acidoferrales bacterium]|nr:LssY C-terminal domain-containing protein [Candidatus Acidoferrales bacterium]
MRVLFRMISVAAIFHCSVVFPPPSRAQQDANTSPPPAATNAAIPAGATAIAGKSYEVDVPVSEVWLDTKIDLLAGAQIQITATGTATYPFTDSKGQSKDQTFNADGVPRGWRDLIHQYPVPNSGHGALIGRIGSGDGSQPFAIGQNQKSDIPVPGRLFLGINEGSREAATARGSFHATIAVISAGTGDANAPFLPDTALTTVTSDLLEKIPRRVSDPSGNPGDMVNVLLIGTQDDVTATFKAAGWVQVDKSVTDTILTGALATFSKEAYLTMPMSVLYLFQRAQDYGFAHAEPLKVIESRNHLRAWKSPYEVDGRPVWCIAATHDIGFERDQRNNGLTHKIDPAIDGEREYVNDTLSSTGLVTQRTHVTPPHSLTTAKTATGGEFHSDGRILVLVLKNTATGTN